MLWQAWYLHAWREPPCILPLTCERSNTSQSGAAPDFAQTCHHDHVCVYDQHKKWKSKIEVVAKVSLPCECKKQKN